MYLLELRQRLNFKHIGEFIGLVMLDVIATFFSLINVIIYNVRDKSFRDSVKELFLQCPSCRQLREISG